MQQAIIKKRILDMIANDELIDALGLLIECDKSEAIVLLSRLNFAKKEYQFNLISFKKFERLRSEIVRAAVHATLELS